MNKKQRLRLLAAFLSTLLVLCISFLVILHQSKLGLQAKLNNERLKSESLLSEKLLVKKALEKKEKSNNQLEKKLADINIIVSDQAKRITEQGAKNRQMKKEFHHEKERLINGLSSAKELNKILIAKETDYDKIKGNNQRLTDSLHSLHDEIAFLEREINEVTLRALDQIQIAGIKRNKNKVTSKASAVKKLVAIANVPGVFHDLTYVIEGPDGSILPENDGSITANVIDNDQTVTASNADGVQAEVQPQKLKITFTPNKKLQPGDYTLKIFNSGKYAGSMIVRLR